MTSPVNNPKFYVERPEPKYWNTAHTKAVIEAQELPPDTNGNIFLKVLAPKDFQWKTVRKCIFMECLGPAQIFPDYNSYLTHSP